MWEGALKDGVGVGQSVDRLGAGSAANGVRVGLLLFWFDEAPW